MAEQCKVNQSKLSGVCARVWTVCRTKGGGEAFGEGNKKKIKKQEAMRDKEQSKVSR